ncbi:MAG TPA: hypothetical protein VE913_02800 [Longimicrobium sp.]|nr:hypothetical protein [Longimicrobium sp.]
MKLLRGHLPLAITLAGCASSATPVARAPAANRITACAVREISREKLSVEDGLAMYVEPVALESSGGDVLLAGAPNYLHRRVPGGRARHVPSDSLFGAVIAPDGSARTVRSPIPTKRLGSIRALGRGDGTWDVVFAELIPTERSSPPDTAARLWHGVYDGRRWTLMEPLPLPPNTWLHARDASALVRHGDTLAWAVEGSTPGFNRDVVLFERRSGRWSYEIVPTRGASYPVIAYSDSLGLLLAVVRADSKWGNPDSTRGGQDGNSLFLYTRHPTWTISRRVAHGIHEPVDYPSLVRSGDNVVLTWRAETEGGAETRAVVNVLNGPPDQVVVVDSSIAGWRSGSSMVVPLGNHLWITRHAPPGGHSSELRFLRASPRGASAVGQLPSPFLSRFIATSVGPSDVLLTGTLEEFSREDPNRPDLVVSLLLRVRVTCDSRVTHP